MTRLRKNCATLRVHPTHFSPTSVQLKSEINGAFPCKRHQQHLEFCTILLRTRRSGIRVSPDAPRISLESSTYSHSQNLLGFDFQSIRSNNDIPPIVPRQN
jgi:hypothetical protein